MPSTSGRLKSLNFTAFPKQAIYSPAFDCRIQARVLSHQWAIRGGGDLQLAAAVDQLMDWAAEQLHQDLVIGIKVQNPLDARHTLAMPMDTPAFWCRCKGNPRFSGTKPTVSSFAPCPGPWRWREEPRIVGGKKMHCVHPSAFGGTVVAFFFTQMFIICYHCAIEKWSKRMDMKWIIAIQFNEATQGTHGMPECPMTWAPNHSKIFHCRHPDSSTTADQVFQLHPDLVNDPSVILWKWFSQG